MRPICLGCQVQYVVKDGGLGHIGIEMAHIPPVPYKATFGDVLVCPGCGHEILSNFANQSFYSHTPDFARVVENAMANGIAVLCYERLRDVPKREAAAHGEVF